jgi:hypothetical protein
MSQRLSLTLPMGLYYTIAGAQVELHLSRNSVRKLIKERLLEAREHCGLTVIPDASLRDYCANLPMASLARGVADAA